MTTEFIHLLEKYSGINLSDPELSNGLLDVIPKAWPRKEWKWRVKWTASKQKQSNYVSKAISRKIKINFQSGKRCLKIWKLYLDMWRNTYKIKTKMRLEFKESEVFDSKESQAYPRNIYKWSINTWKDAHRQHLLEKMKMERTMWYHIHLKSVDKISRQQQ